MAKLTREQRRQLDNILGSLRRASEYIHNPHVVVCRAEERATTTLHYTRPPVPECVGNIPSPPLYPVAKDMGSNLVLLPTAIQRLQQFISSFS